MSNAPNSGTSVPTWLLVLTVLIGGGTFGTAWGITQDPAQALLLALLMGIVTAAVGFIVKTSNILQERWATRLADLIDQGVSRPTDRKFRKPYLQHLYYRHRTFDVKGLSSQGPHALELESVFVDLRVAPDASPTPNPVAPPEELRTGSHTIWEYLKSDKTHHLAILGAPGSGKTTLLKHLALTLGYAHKQYPDAPDLLPILLFLRDHAKTIGETPNVSLVTLVLNSLEAMDSKQRPPAEWFEHRLRQGKCLVMLDGLDEIGDEALRRTVVKWVQTQMEANGSNPFILTSRPYGYRGNPLSGVTMLEVQPFTQMQIEKFVHNWYLANEVMSHQKDDPGVRMEADSGARDLLRRISNNNDIAQLAVNPLLLTMIANVHRFRSSLPGRRVELYAEICDVFLGKRKAAEGLEDNLTPKQKQAVLQPLAYELMCQQRRDVSLKDALDLIRKPLRLVDPQVKGEAFLKMIENGSGLLIERERGEYVFAHKTFQEYLAAVHALEKRLTGDLQNFIDDDWWHETLRLYGALEDGTPIVEACLRQDPPPLPRLMLAMECAEEARLLQPEMRERLDTMLTEGIESDDPERRRLIGEALLGLRLRRMVRVEEGKYEDHSETPFITHAEYQVFLDEMSAQGEYHQPDHWFEETFPNGQGRTPVVGVRGQRSGVLPLANQA
jgi:energy-coupling factor transporter ATP-binding protein EcfA2